MTDSSAESDGISPLPQFRIVVPRISEKPGVRATFDRVITTFASESLLVVDDGSNDDAASRVSEVGVPCIRMGVSMGKGAVLKRCAQILREPLVVFTDADGAYPTEAIPTMISMIARGEADMVIASRFLKRKERMHIPFATLLGNKFCSWLVSQITGVKITDASSGLRALKRSVLNDLHLYANGLEFEVELTTRALVKRYKVVELPIDYHPPIGANEPRRISDGLNLLRGILRARLRAYPDSKEILKIQRFYEKYSEYREPFFEQHPLHRYQNRRRVTHAIELLAMQIGETVLDLGCGSGYYHSLLLNLGVYLVGVDFSAAALRMAKRRNANAEYVVAAALSLPFRDKSFRSCICLEVLEHVLFPYNLVLEVKRIMIVRGKAVFSTPNWLSSYGLLRTFLTHFTPWTKISPINPPDLYDSWFTADSLKSLIENAGLRCHKLYGSFALPPYHVGNRYFIPKFEWIPRVYEHFENWINRTQSVLRKYCYTLIYLCEKPSDAMLSNREPS